MILYVTTCFKNHKVVSNDFGFAEWFILRAAKIRQLSEIFLYEKCRAIKIRNK